LSSKREVATWFFNWCSDDRFFFTPDKDKYHQFVRLQTFGQPLQPPPSLAPSPPRGGLQHVADHPPRSSLVNLLLGEVTVVSTSRMGIPVSFSTALEVKTSRVENFVKDAPHGPRCHRGVLSCAWRRRASVQPQTGFVNPCRPHQRHIFWFNPAKLAAGCINAGDDEHLPNFFHFQTDSLYRAYKGALLAALSSI
jgi:hypothetical protein